MKKGFTLIELIAVIVILGVVAIISTPIVLNVIDDTKESANKASLLGYVDAIKLYVSQEQMKNDGILPSVIDKSKIDFSSNNVICTEVYYIISGALLGNCKVGDSDTTYWYSEGAVTSTKPDNYDALKATVPVVEP